jgi:hypothetical protein
MLIDGWRAGHGSRRQLREWLQQVREYDGASGRVAFSDDRRVNSALQLLRIGADGSAAGLGENELPEIATSGPAADLPTADLPVDDAPWESMP